MTLGTALITGASGGIGAIYADRLARRGHDLILVARNREKLQKLASRLSDQTRRSVEVIAADLGDAGDLASVEAVLRRDASITMLVNNAGVGTHTLPARVQEQIAIAAANGCDYCLAAHTGAGRAAGLSTTDLANAQLGRASDGHAVAILRFALAVNADHGRAGPAALAQARASGLADAEILEVITHVAVSILTNSINNLVGTSLDFPRVARVEAAAA